MKKAFILLGFFFFYAFGNQANNVIGWNYLQVIFKKYDFFYERIITNKNSIKINPIYGGKYNNDEWQVRVNLSFDHYFKENFKGWCLSPLVSFFYAQADYPNIVPRKQSVKTISPALSIAYHWLFNDRFTMGVGMGVGPVIHLHRDALMNKGVAYFMAIEHIGIVF